MLLFDQYDQFDQIIPKWIKTMKCSLEEKKKWHTITSSSVTDGWRLVTNIVPEVELDCVVGGCFD